MSIRELARALDLSIGTVSRALNDRPDVNAETRARVKEAARRIGYQPDQSGRSLRKGSTGFVAAVLPTGPDTSSDGGLLRLLEGARRVLLREDIDLIVLLQGPEQQPLEHLRRVVTRHIADALMISHTIPADPRLKFLDEAGVRHVVLGRSEGIASGSFIDFDVETVAADSAARFAEQGHRRIALLTRDARMNFEELMARAFRRAAARAGLEIGDVHVLDCENTHLAAAGRALLADPNRRPTAILTTHESLAAALYHDIRPLGLEVGREIALISTSPTVDFEALVPRLSHYHADLAAAGRAIGERLVQQIRHGHEAGAGTLLMPMRFVPLESHQVDLPRVLSDATG